MFHRQVTCGSSTDQPSNLRGPTWHVFGPVEGTENLRNANVQEEIQIAAASPSLERPPMAQNLEAWFYDFIVIGCKTK